MIAAAELVSRVRCLLNEAEPDEQLSLLSEDTRSIDKHILALLPQAVAITQRNKGYGAGCVNARNAALQAVEDGNGGVKLSLPADFVSLVSLQLSGWNSPCVSLSPQGSAEAAAQKSEFTRAGVFRPVAIEGVDEQGSRIALLYPLPGDDAPSLEHFVYEAEFNAADGLRACSGQMADAVVYNCAALLYNVFERPDAANTFLSLAMALCGGNRTERR